MRDGQAGEEKGVEGGNKGRLHCNHNLLSVLEPDVLKEVSVVRTFPRQRRGVWVFSAGDFDLRNPNRVEGVYAVVGHDPVGNDVVEKSSRNVAGEVDVEDLEAEVGSNMTANQYESGDAVVGADYVDGWTRQMEGGESSDDSHVRDRHSLSPYPYDLLPFLSPGRGLCPIH